MIEIDRKSLLVHVSSDVTLGALENALNAVGLTHGFTACDAHESVRDFLEGDLRGAPSTWNDPADHLLAGMSAIEKNGTRKIDMKPAPRRAVGPDLSALVIGQRGRFFELTSAWIRVHERTPEPSHPSDLARNRLVFGAPNAGSPTREEEALFEKIATALTTPDRA